MTQTTLSFSSSVCEAMIVEPAYEYEIKDKSIVINASDVSINTDNSILAPWRSGVYSNIKLSSERLIILSESAPFDSVSRHSMKQIIENEWRHAYDIFQIDALRDVELWRSKKDKSIDKVELNLWYASAGTNCGIHNEHDFLELHTQVYGLGIMQKFATSNPDSLFSETYMAPGYTHEPFCDSDLKYPWHQYSCVSDSVWLAIEFY